MMIDYNMECNAKTMEHITFQDVNNFSNVRKTLKKNM